MGANDEVRHNLPKREKRIPNELVDKMVELNLAKDATSTGTRSTHSQAPPPYTTFAPSGIQTPLEQLQLQPRSEPPEGCPFVFDPNATYSHPNVQAWAEYYAAGGTDPTGAVYFISVPGIKEVCKIQAIFSPSLTQTWIARNSIKRYTSAAAGSSTAGAPLCF
jgi:hypothetical protein